MPRTRQNKLPYYRGKDNLILQRPRGKNPGGLYADKSPTLTQTAWEQNNLVIESVCLTSQRTEYGKAIRRQYEAHEVTEPHSAITRLEPRTDGKTNTITTVQKDNLIMQLNPSRESNGVQPYQQNRVYDPDGIAPALMEGTGGRTIKVLETEGADTPNKAANPYRVRPVANRANVVQLCRI